MFTHLILMILMKGFLSLECNPTNVSHCEIFNLKIINSDEVFILEEERVILIKDSFIELTGSSASILIKTNNSMSIQNSTLRSRVLNITAIKLDIFSSILSADGTVSRGRGYSQDIDLFGHAHASPGTDCHIDIQKSDKSYGHVCASDYENDLEGNLLGSGGDDPQSFGILFFSNIIFY